MNNSQDKKNFFSNLLEKVKNNKKIQYVIVGALSIIVLVIFCSNFNTKENENISDEQAITSYVYSLENRLAGALSRVKGAGEVSVVITVKSGKETVLATNTTVNETINGIERIETPVIINGKTIVVKETFPEIVGVLIVAEGASNIYVMSKIQQATVSLLDVKPNQIEILTMK